MLSPHFLLRRFQRAYVFVDWFRDYQEIKDKKRDNGESGDEHRESRSGPCFPMLHFFLS
jgi:hypothetical protein